MSFTISAIDVPVTWAQIPWETLLGVILVVGAVDTGKTTLVRYVWQRIAHGGAVALVDADVGQSILGPPTTQTLRLASPEQPHRFPPRGRLARWFVGSVSPRGHMLPTVIGAFRLVERARKWGAKCILVDTTGMVHPSVGGVALKWAQFDLIRPHVVVAIQREDELEPLIAPWRRSHRFRLIELPVSSSARPRSRESRIAWRQYRFRLYFQRAQEMVVPLSRVPVLGETRLSTGRLIGFLDRGGFLVALGIIREVAETHLRVWTPLRTLERVDVIRVGSIFLDDDFRDHRVLRHSLSEGHIPGGEDEVGKGE